MKNYYWGAFLISFLTLVILLFLNLLPAGNFLGYRMRKVDLLSDVRLITDSLSTDTVSLDSIVKKNVKPAYVDTCKMGLTCIVDYSDSTMRGMKHFYEILDSIKNMDRPVRIAVFGDSFIEGDIFTADLRRLMQNKFGGNGVGYVNITSNVAGFRPTVRHRFSGWTTRHDVDSLHDNSKLGLNSSYYISNGPGAWVELEGMSSYSVNTSRGQLSNIYFESLQDMTDLSCSVNKDSLLDKTVYGKGLKVSSVSGDIKSVRWIIGDSVSAIFYGVTMEGRKGIVVDNLSLRGSSGYNILSIPEHRLKNFGKIREYDLIILQYGLNVATPNGKKYDNYSSAMEKVVEKIKRCFPNSSILLLSIGDRKMKDDNGNFVTMPGVKNLVKYQEAIAANTGIAFWNMFDLFTNLGGIEAFVNAKPAMANLDYTHINFRGGKKLAECLFESLVYGKENYDRRKAYEAD